jgi:hypothetical protein
MSSGVELANEITSSPDKHDIHSGFLSLSLSLNVHPIWRYYSHRHCWDPRMAEQYHVYPPLEKS